MTVSEVANYPLSKRVARWLETQADEETARVVFNETRKNYEQAQHARETAEKLLIGDVPSREARRFLVEIDGVVKLLEISRATGLGGSDIVALYDVEKLEV